MANSSGLIECSQTAHGYGTAAQTFAVTVSGSSNTTNLPNGVYTGTVVDANHYTLAGTTYVGATVTAVAAVSLFASNQYLAKAINLTGTPGGAWTITVPWISIAGYPMTWINNTGQSGTLQGFGGGASVAVPSTAGSVVRTMHDGAGNLMAA